MTDKALCKSIGAYIKQQRLTQNQTQEAVADKAGISRSTLSLLERGETVTLKTLIQVIRVLNLLHIMDSFEIKQQISPLALAKLKQKKRKRSRSKKSEATNPQSEW